ncbi:tol-pal system protein YbgF [Sulfitobacter aestuarii]|uniref:Cell division coordinator CpoB n=1 Tax=Sulfitobacter aestuarii TaxID=2161676 RepID=A0ABW5TWD8_9RHOB
MRFVLAVTLGLILSPGFAMAQDAQTLADVRQELTILNVEMQKLRRELSTSGGASVAVTGSSVLERVNSMESELQRLTSKTEELENRVNRVVSDGTNRIGDLEFRLVELEGGDVGALGETSTLGGGEIEPSGGAALPAASPQPSDPAAATATPSAPATPIDSSELAVNEEADFKRAQEALASSDFRSAADLFETFNETYPGGPLAAEAELRRGEALNGLGDSREAARAFLASFSTDPVGPVAPQALFHLGQALGTLGQIQEACVTLSEVAIRFPGNPAVAEAEAERRALNCS